MVNIPGQVRALAQRDCTLAVVSALAAAAHRELTTVNTNELLPGLVLQYFSATKCLPFRVARSSYFPLLDRLGSLTFGLRTFSNGIAFRIFASQVRRARRWSSKSPLGRVRACCQWPPASCRAPSSSRTSA